VPDQTILVSYSTSGNLMMPADQDFADTERRCIERIPCTMKSDKQI